METVFPLAAEDVNDGDLWSEDKDVYENHMHSIHGNRNAVMLIRLRHPMRRRLLSVLVRKTSTTAITTPTQDLYPHWLPDLSVRGSDQPHSLPVPPVAVRRFALR